MTCNATPKEMSLKLTPQRRLILDIIHDCDAHLTGQETLECVCARVSGVNKSTIYRTLELLEKLVCVFKSELGDRFIYHHAEEGNHHIVCRECGKTTSCDERPLPELPGQKLPIKASYIFCRCDAISCRCYLLQPDRLNKSI
jgi:Fur family ferric uptake transcriptional regulator